MNSPFGPRFVAQKGAAVPLRPMGGSVQPTFGAKPGPVPVKGMASAAKPAVAPAIPPTPAPAPSLSQKAIPVNPKDGPPCPVCRG